MKPVFLSCNNYSSTKFGVCGSSQHIPFMFMSLCVQPCAEHRPEMFRIEKRRRKKYKEHGFENRQTIRIKNIKKKECVFNSLQWPSAEFMRAHRQKPKTTYMYAKRPEK